MLSRANVMREALSEMENQRAKNLSEEKKRRDEAERRSPAIAELLAWLYHIESANGGPIPPPPDTSVHLSDT